MTTNIHAAKVAVVGAGFFARFHHDAWDRNPRSDIIGVVDQDLGKAKASGYPAYSSLAELLQDTNPDIIDIATPPNTHLGLIEHAIQAAPQAIICQKPFCGTLPNARRAVHLAADAGIPLIVHENFRFQPWYRRLKQEIDAGALGDLRQLTFRLRPGDGQGPDAYLSRQPYFQTMPQFLIHETGVHWIDTFRFLMGEPIWVYADLRRENPVIAGEDAGYFTFAFENGARALFDGNRLLDHAADNHRLTMGEALLEGTQGSIRLTGRGELLLRRFQAQEETLLYREEAADRFGGDCVYALQDHVLDCVLDGAPAENAASDYLRVMALEACLYESDRRGARVRVEDFDSET